MLVATLVATMTMGSAHGQAVGSLGNFDCVNDTGETAEGFEIEIEDIQESDITREFPSNFLGQEYVQRFGVPTVAAYDETAIGGHKGVRVTWAATWDPVKLKWVAKWGSYVYGTLAPAGDGVAYVKRPTATQGDSCWLLGQGAAYATSGCDHFGLSFTATAVLGKVSYHWKVPDRNNPGHLINATWNSPPAANPYMPYFPPAPPIPAMPVQAYAPPAAPGVAPIVHAQAEAPENPEPTWGPAYWVKTYTSFSKVPVNLDGLQKNLIPLKAAPGKPVKISWALLQKPPPGVAGEKEDVNDDPVGAGNLAIVRRYEYYQFTGYYDPETHEASCGADLGQPYNDCTVGPRSFTYTDPDTLVTRKIVEKGKFLGAHMNGFNIP
jgi:hypothetical protein